jgi:serine protease
MRRPLLLLALVACNAPVELLPTDVTEEIVEPMAPDAVDTAGAVDDTDAAPEAVVADPRDEPLVGAIAAVQPYAQDRVLVGTFGFAPKELTVHGHTLVRRAAFRSIDGGVYGVPDGLSPVDVAQWLQASGAVAYAELDYERHASAVNDPYRKFQWALDKVGADKAWTMSTGTGVVVAVIDTGVGTSPNDGLTHLNAGWDFVNDDGSAADDNGHGTHVASTIGERANNGVGAAGLAYNVTILPVKVLNQDGSGSTSNVILGVEYAVAHGAKVINLSLGSSSSSQAEAAAMQVASAAGVFIAAATGNDAGSTINFPAAYPTVVAVGATGYRNTVAPYSNKGSGIDLVAPGGDNSVDANGDGYNDGILAETKLSGTWSYYFYEGTSMATPHVAAAAALVMAKGATAAQAESTLKSSALDLGAAGADTTYGAGLIQVDKALTAWAAAHPANTAPTAVTGGPYTSRVGVARSLNGAGSSDREGSITRYAWTFGDGGSAVGASVSHTWTKAGTYTVTLTVTDNQGLTAKANTTATITASTSTTCDFAGTISTTLNTFHNLGTAPTGRVLDEWLRWTTTTADLDFILETAPAGTSTWSGAAGSSTAGSGIAEHITYTVPSRLNGSQFRWRVVRKVGTSAYCIGR